MGTGEGHEPEGRPMSTIERRPTAAPPERVVSEGPYPAIMEVVTDPEDIARWRARQERFTRNADWLQVHLSEVYSPENRGRFVCIAGEEPFVADSAQEALALGEAAHPEDDGSFVRYIHRQRLTRFYATLR